MLEALKPAIEWLHFHPIVACIVTLFIAFSESIAFIGLVVPGSLLLVGIGTLIGSGVITPFETIVSAIVGAILGDFVSFWMGHHYSTRIHSVWPFNRWPGLLKKGEAFFHRHGGKGVFLGRFVGPVRPITPVIAGMLKMPILHFVIVDVISAILWAIAYMLPGIVLGGAASSELSHEAVPNFILVIVGSILIIALLYWVILKIIQLLTHLYRRFEKHVWSYIQRMPQLSLLKKIVYTPLSSEREHQIDLFFLLILSTGLFIFIAYQVSTNGFLTHYNQPLNYFFRSLRTLTLDKIMVMLTFLGEKRPMGVLLLVTGLCLLWKRYYRAAFFWFLNGLLIYSLTGIVKIFIHAPRPLGIQGAAEQGWSFPSGHTGLSIALLGMLALMFSQSLPRFVRKYIYVSTFVLSLLIALSRLYLGAHWLTDVLAALCLGLMCLSFSALLYRHQKNHLTLKASRFIVAFTLLAWLGSWAILLTHEGPHAFEKYQLSWPKGTITFKEWRTQNGNEKAPLYRSNRFGKPIQTMNIQLVGNTNLLQKQLLKQGWSVLDENALKILLYKLSKQPDGTGKLPLMTQQYLNKAPALAMYKTLNSSLLILRLWHSGVEIMPGTQTLFVGEINYHHAWHPRLLRDHQHFKQLTNTLPPVLDTLRNDLRSMPNTQLKAAPFDQYPPLNDTDDRDWNGSVLLIRIR